MINFNPVKIDESTGEEKEGIVWNRETLDLAIDAMKMGKPLVSYPFEGKRDTKYKKPNITYEWNDQEKIDFIECAIDIHKFATFCKVNTDDGYKPIILRDYQEEMVDNYVDNQYNVVLASRQIGKTIVSSIYLLWFALFHPEKTVLVISNKWRNSKELMKKIQDIYCGLPFHLKAGVVKHNQEEIEFDTGSRILAQTATEDAGIGLAIDLLYLDEFAHIPANMIDRVYEQLIPTVSSRKDARIIITSTPNGFNRFHKIYDDAVREKSKYIPTRVDWWEVPYYNERLGKYILRDEEWRKIQIGIITEDGFAWQYDNQFTGGGKNLLDSDQLQKLIAGQEEFECMDMPNMYTHLEKLPDYDFIEPEDLVWHPEYEIEKLKTDFLLLSIDMGEGVGLDYTAVTIWRLGVEEFYNRDIEKLTVNNIALTQIGRYRSNKIPPDTFAKWLLALTTEFGVGRYKMLIERNSEGAVMMEKLIRYKKDYPRFSYDYSVIKTKRGEKRYEYGLTVDRRKYEFCANTKTSIKTNRVIFSDIDIIDEAKNFNKHGSSYKASVGHDDMYMTVINLQSILYRDNLPWQSFANTYIDFILGVTDHRSLMERAADRLDNEKRNVLGFALNDLNNIGKRKMLTPQQQRELNMSKMLSDKINSGESFAYESRMLRNPKMLFFAKLNGYE